MSELWITVNTAADLLQVSERTIRRQCALNKYTIQTVSSNVGRGGVSYQIDLASLPERAQVRYWERTSPQSPLQSGEGLSAAAGNKEFRESKEFKEFRDGGNATHAPALTGTPSNLAGEKESGNEIARNRLNGEVTRNERSSEVGQAPRSAVSAGLNAKNREVLERNLEVIEFFKGLRGEEIDSALIQWNSERGDSLNKRTVYRILQKFRDGGAAAVAGKYGGRKGETTVSDEWFGIFMKAFAFTGNPTSINACREVARGYAIKTGQIEPDADFPSAHAFRRRLRSMPQQALNMMRLGLDYHKQHNAYYIDIDRDEANCGDVFVADHAKFDFFVRTKNDKLVRPWISALCDYKSRLIVGYDLFLDDPNGDHIIIVLKRSFEAYGIPKMLLFDNGKDYRRKDIGGGRAAATNELIDDFSPTITNILGIQIKFATPYNSQTKPIERVFGIFRNYFDKFMTGYAGSDGKKRPDKTKKMELDAAKALRQGKTLEEAGIPVMTEEQFMKLTPEFIDLYNKRVFEQGKAKGFSPLSMWNSEAPQLRQVMPKELAILCTSSGNPVKVRRNELRDTRSGEKYIAAWMAAHEGSDQMFWLRVDPEKPETAYCFFADKERKPGEMKLGAFVGTAVRKESIRLYDNSEENQKKLSEQMEIKNSIRRFARDEIKKIVGGSEALTPEEYITYMSAAVNADHEASCRENNAPVDAPDKGNDWQISRFTSIPDEIDRMEHAGVLKKDKYRYVEDEEEEEKPVVLVRFKRK